MILNRSFYTSTDFALPWSTRSLPAGGRSTHPSCMPYSHMFYLRSSRAGGGLQPEGATSFTQDSLWGPTEPILKKAYLFVLQLSHDLTRFKAHCEEKMRGLVASTVGAMEIQQAKQRQERKVVWLLLTLCSEHVVQSRPKGAWD